MDTNLKYRIGDRSCGLKLKVNLLDRDLQEVLEVRL